MENITANLPAPVNATLDETAAYLKVSRRTVQLYQERGLLKPVYFGKTRLFRWKEIVALAKSGVSSRELQEA
jgi:DNA-binding transcriptional MerR regulator